jgi:hypothetical protein
MTLADAGHDRRVPYQSPELLGAPAHRGIF